MQRLTKRFSGRLSVLLALLGAASLDAAQPAAPADLAEIRVAGPLPTSVPWGADIRARVPRFAPDRLLVNVATDPNRRLFVAATGRVGLGRPVHQQKTTLRSGELHRVIDDPFK